MIKLNEEGKGVSHMPAKLIVWKTVIELGYDREGRALGGQNLTHFVHCYYGMQTLI